MLRSGTRPQVPRTLGTAGSQAGRSSSAENGITIDNTVISTDAGDKVFEPGYFFIERFRDFLIRAYLRGNYEF